MAAHLWPPEPATGRDTARPPPFLPIDRCRRGRTEPNNITSQNNNSKWPDTDDAPPGASPTSPFLPGVTGSATSGLTTSGVQRTATPTPPPYLLQKRPSEKRQRPRRARRGEGRAETPCYHRLSTPSHDTMSEDTQGASMDRILQEISAVGRKLEGMDTAMSALTAETRSMRLEIAGFQSQISGLVHRVAAVESQVVLQTDRDQELLYLRSKLIDLEDRSRRNNILFLGFPEGIEGTDILSYLRDTLPKLADITFDPTLEFQRAHRLGLKRQNGKDRPRPIIACFLRHGQVRQLLQLSQRQGPLRLGPLEICLSADFSKETADPRRAFLSLRPRHLDVKFGLFEPARMWITKNGESRTFYYPEDLKSFLEGLHDPTQPMESTTQPPPRYTEPN
ncbi:hypothetical protein NDU88_002781 [Pleurodeles waltl]|uniref:L1 transposable element RRM domain-containing protein n=1 Tax=Pleurodeles waltl TaxID=8319 RepID=A0AAV7P810_PLEWA|nr:hypothetical protein NDU88_002781 [Pleurodeles waltl]